ncbi:hypothetical protein L195_g034242 [Trifolium pratense]|uniref:Uncharacterized protein n=1 Tax=Trifolium pratense TaxID=57577 RepID=A0A2K3LI97_TRIPR|nr:hypothetical protein L195_g034242 [Trifolium pratense]
MGTVTVIADEWNSQKLHIGCEQGELQCPSKLDAGCDGSQCYHLTERSSGNPAYDQIIVVNCGTKGIMGGSGGCMSIHWKRGV